MQGSIEKMVTRLANPVQYHLPIGETTLDVNARLGQHLNLQYTGQIFCVHCQKKTSKSFNQGYCYPCFMRLAQCDMCIMKPETCHYHAGTCREPEWAQAFCFQSHYVYLANSSGIKVGITRGNQVPTRWIDQGAVQALPIFKVASRQISGLIEVIIARHISDKTSWQQMLKASPPRLNLPEIRDELLSICQTELAELSAKFAPEAIARIMDAETVEIDYPILQYPAKIKSLSFDKDSTISGKLQGIKGQYLIFDTGVINMRKFGGYEIKLLD